MIRLDGVFQAILTGLQRGEIMQRLNVPGRMDKCLPDVLFRFGKVTALDVEFAQFAMYFGVIAVANRTGIGLTTTVEMAMQLGLASLSPRRSATTASSTRGAADMAAYVGTYSQGPRTIELLVRDTIRVALVWRSGKQELHRQVRLQRARGGYVFSDALTPKQS